MSEGIVVVVGVDPGLVHTGVVTLSFYPGLKTLEVRSAVVAGDDDPDTVVHEALAYAADHTPDRADAVFVEAYTERGTSYGTNPKMRALMQSFRRIWPTAQQLDNMGVKKVVRPKLLEILGIRKFRTTTHHQDLEAAARILVFGMLKDEELNSLVADVVLAHIAGEPWEVQHL